MKQYLLSVHYVEGQAEMSPAETEAMFERTGRLNKEMEAAGSWVFAGGLGTPDLATVVSAEKGRTTTTDGPFAESKEHVAGFWVLKCEDLDAALSWAEQASVACACPVEVRPFDDLSQA
jgi:hypothetical protein